MGVQMEGDLLGRLAGDAVDGLAGSDGLHAGEDRRLRNRDPLGPERAVGRRGLKRSRRGCGNDQGDERRRERKHTHRFRVRRGREALSSRRAGGGRSRPRA